MRSRTGTMALAAVLAAAAPYGPAGRMNGGKAKTPRPKPPQHIQDRLIAKAEAKRARKRRQRLMWRGLERLRARIVAQGYYTEADLREGYALMHGWPSVVVEVETP
jgi:hypothetical protein